MPLHTISDRDAIARINAMGLTCRRNPNTGMWRVNFRKADGGTEETGQVALSAADAVNVAQSMLWLQTGARAA